MAFEPPADLTNGLSYEALSSGVVRVHVVRDGKAAGHLDCREADLGFMAASMLNFAAQLNEERGAPAASRVGQAYQGPVVLKSSVMVVRDNGFGEGLVVFRTGEAEIGVRVPNAALSALGRALLAAGGGPAA